jgi:hypothetical protein
MSRAEAPRPKQVGEIHRAHFAVLIQIGCGITGVPGIQEDQQILAVHHPVVIKVGEARWEVLAGAIAIRIVVRVIGAFIDAVWNVVPVGIRIGCPAATDSGF